VANERVRQMHFNTKKVRLKPAYRYWPTKSTVDYFNTKKVRLKPSPRTSSFTYSQAFQYQKGAIKTASQRSKSYSYDEFQYQKGAIKTFVERPIVVILHIISIPKRCD